MFGHTIWEFKCTSELILEHKLQLIVYAWMSNVLELNIPQFRLLNIKTGECLALSYTEEVNDVIRILLTSKCGEANKLTDDEFIASLL